MHTTNRVIIIGIENETNVIQALRYIGFPKCFAKRLHMVIRKQHKKAISSYGVKLQQIYADFTDEEIIRQSICRCGFSEKNMKMDMKQLGNLAIVAARHKECLLQIHNGRVTFL